MKAPDPLFHWRIHFWYFHAPRRGIALWKTEEGEEVPRKATVITEMIIILTMRLVRSRDFYGKNDRSVDEERSNRRGALKSAIRKEGRNEGRER